MTICYLFTTSHKLSQARRAWRARGQKVARCQWPRALLLVRSRRWCRPARCARPVAPDPFGMLFTLRDPTRATCRMMADDACSDSLLMCEPPVFFISRAHLASLWIMGCRVFLGWVMARTLCVAEKARDACVCFLFSLVVRRPYSLAAQRSPSRRSRKAAWGMSRVFAKIVCDRTVMVGGLIRARAV